MTTTAPEARTVDLDEAKRLLKQVCEAEPNRTDDTQLYFDPDPESGNSCNCVVGGVIEALGKGLGDLHSRTDAAYLENGANGEVFSNVSVDGVEFTGDAILYLDIASQLNDIGVLWGQIPQATDGSWKLAHEDVDA